IRFAYLLFNGFILPKLFEIVNVNIFPARLFDQLEAFFDVAKATLAENVKFVDADVFRSKHVHLYACKSFGRQKAGSILCYLLLSYQHSARMYRKNIREAT